MLTIAMNGTKHLVLDRRKFLGVAAGLVAAGVIPKKRAGARRPLFLQAGRL